MFRRFLIAAALIGAAAGVVLFEATREPPLPPAVQHAAPPTRGRPPVRVPRPYVRLVLPRALPRRTLTVPILMYHLIGSPRPAEPPLTRRLTVDPSMFGAEMRWLETNGFRTITQEQLFAALEYGAPLPRKPVMITFDDGYRDVLWNAVPILARLHLRATDYVITGRISGRDSSFLTWPQLRALEHHGVEIGSHTVHHVELPGVSDRVAFAELMSSRRALEAHLRHPVQWFSYPAGRESPRVVSLVRKAGYVLAVTTHPGAAQAAFDPLRLRRVEVLSTTGVAGLAALVER